MKERKKKKEAVKSNFSPKKDTLFLLIHAAKVAPLVMASYDLARVFS